MVEVDVPGKLNEKVPHLALITSRGSWVCSGQWALVRILNDLELLSHPPPPATSAIHRWPKLRSANSSRHGSLTLCSKISPLSWSPHWSLCLLSTPQGSTKTSLKARGVFGAHPWEPLSRLFSNSSRASFWACLGVCYRLSLPLWRRNGILGSTDYTM